MKQPPMFNVPDNYISRVRQWIENGCEVFMIARYARSAGLRAYGYLRDECDFQKAVTESPIGTELIAFREPQLPMRCWVDLELIGRVLQNIADGTEYLVVDLSAKDRNGLFCPGSMGDSNMDLHSDLERLIGHYVAIGICPRFTSDDSDTMISASVGGVNAPR